MSSPSSSCNLISPHPPQKKDASAAPTAHPLTSLPSYAAPVCEKSDVSKKEIIDALNGKTRTMEGTFSSSKQPLIDVLVPIVKKQDRFFCCFDNVDKENAAESTDGGASSLKESLAL